MGDFKGYGLRPVVPEGTIERDHNGMPVRLHLGAKFVQPTPEWYENELELLRVEGMLTRAGVLRDSPHDRKDFREKPWHWSRERESCDRIEAIIIRAGVPSHEGWEMTLTELAEKLIEMEGIVGG